MPDFQQALANANPILIFVAAIAGLLAFLLFRTMFRALGFIFHLGCLVVVAVGVYLILQNAIK